MQKIKNFISEYFFRAHDIVEKYNPDNKTVIQFFQKHNNAILAGMNEALAFLKKYCANKNLKVLYLPEGTKIQEKEIVLQIEGRYQDFGIYEGIIDGILSRATSIATNSYKCVLEAKGKEVICMADRSDHYCNQGRDAEAMLVGGITSFCTMGQALSVSKNTGKSIDQYKVYGSIPHALIQNFEGNLLQAMIYYDSLFEDENELIALVDFHNDVIVDSLKVLKHFKEKLKGIRVDTSRLVRDLMFTNNEDEYGVTPTQIKRLREELDKNGGKHVKICVSSGFDPEKIKYFEAENTPVDAYGIGEYLLKIEHGFCADAVMVNGKKIAKFGREYRENPKLIEYL